MKPRTARAKRIAERAAEAERWRQINEVNTAHVKRGTCPTCGAKLRRNLSLTGWWQCEQLGAEGFRKDASKPSCNFQFFIDEPRR